MRSLARTISLLTLVTLASGISWSRDAVPLHRRTSSEPVPIPGGLVPFAGAPFVHVFAPGPSPPFMGLNVEPNAITDFNGFAAMAYLGGTAQDAAGNRYDMQCDIRVYRGEYVSADGRHQHGTFGFI